MILQRNLKKGYHFENASNQCFPPTTYAGKGVPGQFLPVSQDAQVDGDEAICDLKILLANITKRKQETTEKNRGKELINYCIIQVNDRSFMNGNFRICSEEIYRLQLRERQHINYYVFLPLLRISRLNRPVRKLHKFN